MEPQNYLKVNKTSVFEGKPIFSVLLPNNERVYLANDVAAALGYAFPRDVIRNNIRLNEWIITWAEVQLLLAETGVEVQSTPNNKVQPSSRFLYIPAVLVLVNNSTKANTLEFYRWVWGDVMKAMHLLANNEIPSASVPLTEEKYVNMHTKKIADLEDALAKMKMEHTMVVANAEKKVKTVVHDAKKSLDRAALRPLTDIHSNYLLIYELPDVDKSDLADGQEYCVLYLMRRQYRHIQRGLQKLRQRVAVSSLPLLKIMDNNSVRTGNWLKSISIHEEGCWEKAKAILEFGSDSIPYECHQIVTIVRAYVPAFLEFAKDLVNYEATMGPGAPTVNRYHLDGTSLMIRTICEESEEEDEDELEIK